MILGLLLLAFNCSARSDWELDRITLRDVKNGEPVPAPVPRPVPAPTPIAADNAAQMSGPATRNQGSIGSCHSFGSIALLEAAYKRRTGEAISLSEADIFLRRIVLQGAVYDDYLAKGDTALHEGGHMKDDLQYALDYGVATSVGYAGFEKRYEEYRRMEQASLAQNDREFADTPWYVKLFHDPREEWVSLQDNPGLKKNLETWLNGADKTAASERLGVWDKIKDFKIAEKSFAFLDAAATSKLSEDQCRSAGAEQARAIQAELSAGRPVGVSMNLAFLPAWGQTDQTRDANHAFVVTASEFQDGKQAFKVRNSWGGANPDVLPQQLCRVYDVITVLLPGEKPAFDPN